MTPIQESIIYNFVICLDVEMSSFSPSKAVDRRRWTRTSTSSGDAKRNVEDTDTFLAGIEAYRYVEKKEIVKVGFSVL